MVYADLMNHYKMNFLLMNEFKWDLSDIGNMMPFEKETYILMLNAHLKEKAERMKG